MTTLEVQERDITGKKVAKLREEGKIPAVLYGPKLKKSVSVLIDKVDFEKTWKDAGETSLVDLVLDGKKKKVLIHEVALEPVKHVPIHVDFYEVDTTKPIHLRIPLTFENDSPAEKTLGGVLLKPVHEIEIEALPEKLPSEIIVDLSKLQTFDDRITVADLELPEGTDIKTEAGILIAFVEPPKTKEQIEEEEASEEKAPEADLESIEASSEKPKEEGEAEVEEEKKEEEK